MEAGFFIHYLNYAPYKNPNNPFQMKDPNSKCCTPNKKSIKKTINAITNDAIDTTTALFCNSDQVGQVTLCTNSS